MSTASASITERESGFRARKNITYLLLFAIVMFFVALSSAYVVSKGSADYWVNFRIPAQFYYSTATIIGCSLTIQMAYNLVRKDRSRAAGLWLVITFLLGLAFTFSQASGWMHLISKGYYMTDKIMLSSGTYGEDFTILRKGVPVELVDGQYYLPEDTAHNKPLNAEMADYKNTASSYFYVLTFGHWLHLAGGMLVLVVLMVKAFLGRYGPGNSIGVWQGTLYWHFLGGLWIYLLLFLRFVH